MTQSTARQKVPGSFPHVYWVDLTGDNILTEVAIMKEDVNGNAYFFPIGSLDNIDKNRLRNILASRNADKYPLWDLMQQITLGNGINALTYFHQLVKVLTPSGQVMEPTSGKIGAAVASNIKPEPSEYA